MTTVVEPAEQAREEKRPFAAAIRSHAPRPHTILQFRMESHLLSFHLGRPLHTLVEWGELNERLAAPGPHFVVMPPEYVFAASQIVTGRKLVVVARLEDYTRGQAAPPARVPPHRRLHRSPMSKPADAVTVVIPVHNAADRLDRVPRLAALDGKGQPRRSRSSWSTTAAPTATPPRSSPAQAHTRVLRHETRRGLRGVPAHRPGRDDHPLFFYTALDYPYTPSDIRPMLDRIDLRDEVLGKQPDLISGCRTGLPDAGPGEVVGPGRGGCSGASSPGMPITDPPPWHGWPAYRYRVRTKWVYGVPLADVNSCFKLFRTAFLKRFPIQSDGDFVHTELVAKATFLTSIMDEVPLTPKPDPIPPLGETTADRRARVQRPALRRSPPEPATARSRRTPAPHPPNPLPPRTPHPPLLA